MLFLPLLLVFYETITYLSTDMYLPALPQMMQDLSITQPLAQLTLTLWFLGTASMQLVLGPIADHYGRRPVLLLGGLMFVVSSILCANTDSIVILLIARFFQGCTVCSVAVAGYATVHELYEHKQAINVLALMSSVTVLAPAFGPLLGGLIIQVVHWRLLFWILAGLASVALLLLFRYMPETNPNKKNKIKLSRLLSQYRAILSNQGFMNPTVIICSTFITIIGWLTATPFLIISVLKYSAIMFGIFQTIVFSGYIIGSRLVKPGIQRFGAPRLIQLALTLEFCAAILCFLWAHFFIHFFLGFIVCFAVYMLGAGLAFGPLSRTAIEACKEPMGLRLAIFSTLLSISAVVASIGISLLSNGKVSSLAAIILIATSVAFLQSRRRMGVIA